MWQGWVVAGANSVVICAIALRTTQTGFIPANLFCMAIYVHNIAKWRHTSMNATCLVDASSEAATEPRSSLVEMKDTSLVLLKKVDEVDASEVAELFYRC